jgi:hypothetical protein
MTSFAMERLDLGKDSSGRPLTLNRRTKAMYDIVAHRIGREPVIVQGSYLKGIAAEESSRTHDAGGVMDLRVWDQTSSQVLQLLTELRRIGFAAWLRTKAQGFDPHIHAVAIGDEELSDQAADQVDAYSRGKNGLAGDGPDDGPSVAFTTFPIPHDQAELDALMGEAMPLTTKDVDLLAREKVQRHVDESMINLDDRLTFGEIWARAHLDSARTLSTVTALAGDLQALNDQVRALQAALHDVTVHMAVPH